MNLFTTRKILLFFIASVFVISCSNPLSSDDDSNEEIWIIENDSTITWNGNKISGNNKSEDPDDYSLTVRYLGISSAPDRDDKNRVKIALTDSTFTTQDYNNIDMSTVFFFIDFPKSYGFLEHYCSYCSANGTPKWFRFSYTHFFYCDDNSSLEKLEFIFQNKGSTQRTYIFNSKGFEKAIKEIAC